jgi:O-antigen ligase
MNVFVDDAPSVMQTNDCNTSMTIRMVLLMASAFFSTWGAGLQGGVLSNATQMFPIFSVMVGMYWVFLHSSKRPCFPKVFYLFVIFAFIHTAIVFGALYRDEFTFGYQDMKSMDFGYVKYDAGRGMQIVRMMTYFFYACAVSALTYSYKEIRNIVYAYGVGIIVTQVVGGYVNVEWDKGFVRMAGGFLDPNELAIAAVVLLYSTLCVLTSFKHTIVSRLMGYALIADAIYLILITESRTCIGATILCVFVVLSCLSLRKRLNAFLLFTIVGCVVFYSLDENEANMITQRVSTKEMKETNGSMRLDIWSDYLRAFPDYALCGTGLTRSIEAIRNTYESDEIKYPHSIYMQTLVEFGIPGFILFLLAELSIWKDVYAAKRIRKDYYRAFFLAYITALCVVGISLSLFDHRSFWLSIGLISGYVRLIRDERIEQYGSELRKGGTNA